MAKTHGTSVRLDHDTHKSVKGIAFWHGATLGQVIAAAVEQYIESRPELKKRLALLDRAGHLNEEAGPNE